MLIKVIFDTYFYIHHQTKLTIVIVIVNMDIQRLLNKDEQHERNVQEQNVEILKKLNLICTN